MEIHKRSSWLLLLLGISLLATALQGVQGEAEQEGPSESECRPYIEKALKELETGEEGGTSEADAASAEDQPGDSKEDTPTVEITTDDSDQDEAVGDDDIHEGGDEPGDADADTVDKDDTAEESINGADKEGSNEKEDDGASQEAGEGEAASHEADDGTGESKEGDEKSAEAEGADKSAEDGEKSEENEEGSEHDAADDDQAQSAEDEQGQSAEDAQGEQLESSESDGQQSAEDAAHDAEDEPSAEEKKESAEDDGTAEETGDSKQDEADSKEGEASAEDAATDEKDDSGNDDDADGDSKADVESTEDANKSGEEGDKSGEDAGRSAEDDTKESQEEEMQADQAAQSTTEAESKEDEKDKDSKEDDTDSKEGDKDSKEAVTDSKEADTDSKEADKDSKEADKDSEEADKDSKEADKDSKEADKESKEADKDSKEADKDSKEADGDSKDGDGDKDASKEEIGEGDEERESGEAPEEELTMEIEIPDELRPRDHIDQILKLDDESSGTETIVDRISEITLRELKRIYENAIKPLEVLYKYRDLSNRHFGDPEIFSKPLILFMGPWSGGKSSIINYLVDNEYNETSLRTGAEPSPAYFNILMHGDEEEVIDGTQLAADFTFSGLQKFGQGLEERLRGLKLPTKVLEKVNIVEIPGILEVRKQVSRVFPFNDACQWFIDRADIIFLVYDPSKLDVGPETEAILDQLKGREHQTRIILNKADQVKPEELMRVQGALIWNISPLMSSAQPPVMYTTSLWSRPYEPWAPVRLLQAQERAFLRDLRSAIDKRIDNKISSARRFAVRVRNHAKMVDCYLTTYYNHKSVFGNKKQVANEIIEHPQDYHIYEGLSTLTNISRYDLPDPEVYRDFFRLNPLYEFQQLSATCTYFRGCPINRLDIAIAYDLPELAGKHKRLVESALAEAAGQAVPSS